MPARAVNVWRVEQGKLICDRQIVNHRITHNGDFDAWMFGDAIAKLSITASHTTATLMLGCLGTRSPLPI
jgi:hypothetical protein